MLKVIPKAWWSHSFSVLDGAETIAQALDRSGWSDKGELHVQGAAYTARRAKASYILETDGDILVRAERPRILSSEHVIAHAGRQYTLRAKSVFRHDFLVFEGARQVGRIAPEGFFTRTSVVELPNAVPLFVQVFLVWLVMTLWKHEAYDGG